MSTDIVRRYYIYTQLIATQVHLLYLWHVVYINISADE